MSQGRGRGRGNSSPQKMDLVPSIPPLYPPCNPPLPLTPVLNSYVPKFNEMAQHMISNFAVKPISCHQVPTGFMVERYSDRYSAPLKLKDVLTYQMDPRRLPAELGPQKSRKDRKLQRSTAKAIELKAKRALEKLAALPDKEDEKEEEGDEDEPTAKKQKGGVTDAPEEKEDDEEKMNQDNDEEEEEVDEELDEGNDYQANYFDNGEGYGDSDEDNLEDSSVY